MKSRSFGLQDIFRLTSSPDSALIIAVSDSFTACYKAAWRTQSHVAYNLQYLLWFGLNIQRSRVLTMRHHLSVITFEKRIDSRMKASYFTVFKKSGKDVAEATPQIGYTRDISAGGVYFTRSDIAIGNDVSLTIHLSPEWEEESYPPKLEGNGKVLRVESEREALPVGYINGVAVQFEKKVEVSF